MRSLHLYTPQNRSIVGKGNAMNRLQKMFAVLLFFAGGGISAVISTLLILFAYLYENSQLIMPASKTMTLSALVMSASIVSAVAAICAVGAMVSAIAMHYANQNN